jgi:hypothetical protein
VKYVSGMKCLWAVALIIVLGCQKNPQPGEANPALQGTSVGNGFVLAMKADLSDAVSLTRTSEGAPEGAYRLKKVTSGKRLADVLDGPHKIFHYKETPTHIVAQVSIEEPSGSCYLIAIPKSRVQSQVYCLSRQELTPYSTTGSLRAGFDTTGSEVYFAHVERSDELEQITELRHWDGHSETTTTVTKTNSRVNRNSYIQQVFASDSSEALCYNFADAYGYASHSSPTAGHLICRKSKTSKWYRYPGVVVDEKALRFHNYILLSPFGNPYTADNGSQKINLATLNREKRTGTLPMTHDFDTQNGGFIGRGDYEVNGTIHCVDRDGNGREIAKSNTKTPLVRIGEYAWFFASQSLKRVSLRACELDPKEFFPDSLFQITKLSYLFGDTLRVDGSDALSGFSSAVYVDAEGRALLTKPTEEVKIDHPIDLKWER